MKPGRELDAHVAESVMGWHLCKCTDWQIEKWKITHLYTQRFGSDRTCNCCGQLYINVWNPSTNIAAAWEVVEKTDLLSIYHLTNVNVGGWAIVELEGGFENNEDVLVGKCESAPHAICLAALKAVGEK